MINTPYKQLNQGHNTIHPALQFLIFVALSFGILILGSIIGAGIAAALYGLKTVTDIMQLNLGTANAINALWIIQIMGTTLPIFAAPVFFAYVIVKQPQYYIKPTFRFPWVLIVLVFAVMAVSNPLIEFLSNINQKMVLPQFLKWMRDSEDNAQKITQAMLQMKTIWDMLLNVLLVGLLTAIAEEFMFRGVIQTILTRWAKNTHAAIWITAILFSAFHVEFFGFLPRLMLGVLFGYFVAWSGSIWPAVWAHFINNGTAVVVTYLWQQKLISMKPDDEHVFNYTAYVFSAVVLAALLFMYRKIVTHKQTLQTDGEKLG